jgi:hypothetical protein
MKVIEVDGEWIPATIDSSTDDAAAPAAGAPAVITYAADPNQRHVISGVAWSYSAAPAGGNLKLEDGAGHTVFSIDVTAAGFDTLEFEPFKRGSQNTAMTLTLAAGGAGVSGKVSVLSHWKE